MRGILVATLLTGCMTDPAGNSCLWQPGSDGYCSTDDGGSSGPKKIFTYYHSPAAASAPDVMVAMARTRTDEAPQIQLATVRPGESPVPVPVTLAGEPLDDASDPRLAAIGSDAYLIWFDTITRGYVGALVDADGAIVGTRAQFGPLPGTLRTVAERFVLVHQPDTKAIVQASWIDRDGRRERFTTVVAAGVDRDGLIGVAGGESIAAIATRHVDGTLVITRVGNDGTVFTVDEIALDGKVTKGNLVVRGDGGVLGVFAVQPKTGAPANWVVVVDKTGATRVTRSTLPPLLAMVRGPRGVLATTDAATSSGLMLDDDGNLALAFELVVPRSNVAIATSDGFAVIDSEVSGVHLTRIAGGVAQPTITVAEPSVEEAGCGCRSSGGGTSVLFAGVLLLALRRRRVH